MEKDQQEIIQQSQENAKDQVDYEKRISDIETKISQLSNLKSELFDMLVSNINQVKKEEPTKEVAPQQTKKILEDF